MKIYIVGCARTGTTLLRRLFNAFADLKIASYEMTFDFFMKSKYNIGKRSGSELFSNRHDYATQQKKAEIYEQSGAKIILIKGPIKDIFPFLDLVT